MTTYFNGVDPYADLKQAMEWFETVSKQQPVSKQPPPRTTKSDTEIKTCPRCNERPRSQGLNRLHAYCKPCTSLMSKEKNSRIGAERAAARALKKQDEAMNGRVCMHCGERKEVELFYSANVCRSCRAAHRRLRIDLVRDAYNQKEAKRRAEYRVAHPEKVREYRIAYRRKERALLGDGYVKRLIVERSELKVSAIPPSLVELKRQHLAVLRLQREVSAVLDDEELVPRDVRKVRTAPTAEELERKRLQDNEKYRKRYYGNPTKEIERVRRYKQRKRQERLALSAKSAGETAGTTTEEHQ